MNVGGTEKSWAELEQAELYVTVSVSDMKKCQFEGNETGT